MTYEINGEEKEPLPSREKHVLSDNEGRYPIGKLGGWEVTVLDTEIARDNTVAWYRSPSSATKDALGLLLMLHVFIVAWGVTRIWYSLGP
jgi:hypothetical protein